MFYIDISISSSLKALMAKSEAGMIQCISLVQVKDKNGEFIR